MANRCVLRPCYYYFVQHSINGEQYFTAELDKLNAVITARAVLSDNGQDFRAINQGLIIFRRKSATGEQEDCYGLYTPVDGQPCRYEVVAKRLVELLTPYELKWLRDDVLFTDLLKCLSDRFANYFLTDDELVQVALTVRQS